MKSTGAEAIVQILEAEGVEYVFGLCGHANVAVLDALYGSSIQFISVRNESTAVHMADAYYRTSHKYAAVLVTVGPGLSNTVTALSDAVTDGAAMLVIAGDVPSYLRGRGALQELSVTGYGNQGELVRPVTKWSSTVPDARLIPHYVYHALNMSQTGGPGPVVVSVPMDFFSEVREFELDDPARRRASFPRTQPDPEGVERAVNAMLKAQRPVLFAGNGVVASEAAEELLGVADLLEVPVATSLVGQACFPKTHRLNIDCPNSVGNPAVAHALHEADLIVAVGTRLGEIETSSWRPDFSFDLRGGRTKLIHMDTNPAEIGKNYPTEVGIVGDAKLCLRQLASSLRTHDLRSAREGWRSWTDQVLELKDRWTQTKREESRSNERPVKTQRLLAELNSAMPPDTIYLIDTGGFGYAAGQHLDTEDPFGYYYNLGMGSMGPCMAGALGAKLANHDRTVVAIVGDGGITCEMSPLVTAAEYGIPVIWVILNNYSYNSIEAYQHKHYSGRVLGTQFRGTDGSPYNPDFAALASACGIASVKVDEANQLPAAFKDAVSSGGPYLIEVLSGETRFPATYGFFEINDFLAEEAKFKNERQQTMLEKA